MRGRKAWIANGLLFVLASGLSLLLAEAAVRVVAPRSTSIAHQDRYGLAMHYAGITAYLPEHDQTVTINSAGMRDREHDLAKAPGTFRVLLLGDSFVEAVQVDFAASIPSLLESGLAARTGRPVEVVSAGVGGWGTDDQLRYLTEYGLAFEPDLVVVAMTLHNDVSDNLRQYWHTARDGELTSMERDPIPTLTYRTLQLKAFVAVRLQVVQLWRRARHGGEITQVTSDLQRHVVELFRAPPSDELRYGFDLTGLLLEELQEVAGRAGASTALVLLPLEYQVSDAAFGELSRSVPDGVTLSDDQPQREMAAIADRLDMPLVDLRDGFRAWTAANDGSLFLDYDGHWNENGHRVASGIVVDQLIESGLVPR